MKTLTWQQMHTLAQAAEKIFNNLDIPLKKEFLSLDNIHCLTLDDFDTNLVSMIDRDQMIDSFSSIPSIEEFLEIFEANASDILYEAVKHEPLITVPFFKAIDQSLSQDHYLDTDQLQPFWTDAMTYEYENQIIIGDDMSETLQGYAEYALRLLITVNRPDRVKAGYQLLENLSKKGYDFWDFFEIEEDDF